LANYRILLLPLLVFVIFSLPKPVLSSESRTTRLSPIADSFAYVNNPQSNYGKETYLYAEYESQRTVFEARSFTAPAWGSIFFNISMLAHGQITGSLDVTEGGNLDINFVITDSDPNEAPLQVNYFYRRDRVTHLDFSFLAPYTGVFYLGFDNSFSYLTAKKISLSQVEMTMEPFEAICSPIFLLFDLSSIPPESTVTSGKLTLAFWGSWESRYSIVDAFYCTQNSWNEQTITFENAPLPQLYGSNTASLNISGVQYGSQCEWDIKSDIVRSLTSRKLTEVLAIVESESSTGKIDFFSRESDNKPRLEVAYTYVSVDSTVSPNVVGQGQNVLITVSTDPLQTGGTGSIQYSSDQIAWHEIVSFVGGSKEQAWTPNVTGPVYVRVLWTSSWSGGSYTSNKTVSFNVDITPPSLTITSPSIGYTLRSANPEVTWSGSDDPAGIDHYEINLDQGQWINKLSNTTHVFKDVSDGNHTVTIKAVDKVGLSKEESVSFIINTSLIGGPGWTDDIIVFGSAAAAILVAGLGTYLWRKKRTEIPPPPP
jgi:hypothetical protein